ncbi:PhzF family phenazine biosynthesis protein [Labrys sp. (in: a-proteobacteria)]|uniref:PhzF family phenazine biosynthesis protein n=1 Tax=Labrys sp. (in: a-proteobacteria) TaxID=1917972 RepID=UPI0039E4E4B3
MQIHKVAAFTENGSGGNPAGVVLAETLPEQETMQRIAAEVGYSETAFAAPSGESWQTRYFSPESEVPFCGHATVALGAVLAEEKGAGRYQLSLSGGVIEVEAIMKEGMGYSTLCSLATRNGPVSDTLVEEALALFGYPGDALDRNLPPRLMSAGAEHLFLALDSRERLSAMSYDLEEGRAFMRHHGLVTVALVWREAERLFHARNAFASGGVIEDPATGAAAAALAGMLRDQGILTQGELTILQGADMGRTSRIVVRWDDPVGSPVMVSGTAAKIA